MNAYFIAIAQKGKEFCFRKDSKIAVPTKSSQKIAEALNRLSYKIKDGETWHIYENDFYYNDYIDAEIKRYGDRMKVYKYRG